MRDDLNFGLAAGAVGTRRRLIRRAAGGALGLAALVGLSACGGEDDSAEEEIDEAGDEVDEAGDEVDEAGDAVEDEAEEN